MYGFAPFGSLAYGQLPGAKEQAGQATGALLGVAYTLEPGIVVAEATALGTDLEITYRIEAGQATAAGRGGLWLRSPIYRKDAHVRGALLRVDYFLTPGNAVAEWRVDGKADGASLALHLFVIAGRARGQHVGLIAGYASAGSVASGAVLHVEHSLLTDEFTGIDNDFLLMDGIDVEECDRDFLLAA
jgi:hypothetical protein